jgi:hypothetical protein
VDDEVEELLEEAAEAMFVGDVDDALGRVDEAPTR